MITPKQELWACALLVERDHGGRAEAFIAERVRTLARAGEMAGGRALARYCSAPRSYSPWIGRAPVTRGFARAAPRTSPPKSPLSGA